MENLKYYGEVVESSLRRRGYETNKTICDADQKHYDAPTAHGTDERKDQCLLAANRPICLDIPTDAWISRPTRSRLDAMSNEWRWGHSSLVGTMCLLFLQLALPLPLA